MRLSHVAAIGALLTMSACVGWLVPKRGPQPSGIGIPSGDGHALPGQARQGRESGAIRKSVRGKREPITLIADDKTECIVPEAKWRETSIGERVLCDWQTP